MSRVLASKALEVLRPADIEAIEATPIAERLEHDNTFDVLAAAAAVHSDRIAIRNLPNGAADDVPLDVTYRELIGKIRQTANLLHTLGIARGDVVAYLLPNLPETYYCLWGAEAAGIVFAINHFLEPEHIGALLRHSRAKVLVVQGPSEFPIWEKLPRIRELAPDLRHILRVGPGPEGPLVRDYGAACAAQPADRLIYDSRPSGKDVAAYFHTGGTTGVPKIAPLTHFNEVVMTWCCLQLFRLSPRDVIYSGMPLFHVSGIKAAGMFPLACGATIVLAGPAGFRNKRSIDEFWRVVERFGVTNVAGPPTVYASLMDRPVNADISTLDFAVVSSAPSPPELFRRFRTATGLSLHEAFGLTEATLVTNMNPRGIRPRDGSAGFRLPYLEQRVVRLGADGKVERDCGPGEIGVVAVRGPAVFEGYLAPASSTGLWLDGDWLNTGDMGRLDEDGYLRITGRFKDMIIRGGHNIDPELIEAPMHEHPMVAHCAAVGKPDAYAGEVPMAFVKLIPHGKATAEELMEHARRNIVERAAVPKDIVIVDDLPFTAVGKIAKNALRDEAARLAIAEAVARHDRLAGQASVTIRRHPSEGATVVVKIVDGALRAPAEALLADYALRSAIDLA